MDSGGWRAVWGGAGQLHVDRVDGGRRCADGGCCDGRGGSGCSDGSDGGGICGRDVAATAATVVESVGVTLQLDAAEWPALQPAGQQQQPTPQQPTGSVPVTPAGSVFTRLQRTASRHAGSVPTGAVAVGAAGWVATEERMSGDLAGGTQSAGVVLSDGTRANEASLAGDSLEATWSEGLSGSVRTEWTSSTFTGGGDLPSGVTQAD
ncbi:hypothetical protein I4F81_007433 [Pyropia yezoensis]|uniref:Uncharacterized protein n=1 Tax=Pyropia yezoensis TaxID=2788 RepID=A0ACC3C514_PYRYE|nr:hypothetical protein I4F81_007433 [Neopyropia yezoensis]